MTKKADGGTRTTTSIPKTGISFVKETPNNVGKKKKTSSAAGKNGKFKSCLAPLAIIMAFLLLIGSCGNEPNPSETTEPSETVLSTEDSTTEGTESMTETPTEEPTETPTEAPTEEPTEAPTEAPTEPPIEEPTEAPTEAAKEQTESGRTYILNTSTKKFHYPSCSSVKNMKESHKKTFTGTREEVIAMGYDPCGRCKP